MSRQVLFILFLLFAWYLHWFVVYMLYPSDVGLSESIACLIFSFFSNSHLKENGEEGKP